MLELSLFITDTKQMNKERLKRPKTGIEGVQIGHLYFCFKIKKLTTIMIAVSSQSKLILKNIFHQLGWEILIGSEFGD